MDEIDGTELVPDEPDYPLQASARELRFLEGLGADVEALGESLRWIPGREPLVYNIQLRAGVREQQDVLMLVKAVGEGGALVAFHSGRTMIDALLSWPGRLRAGKVNWKQDEYTPTNYEGIERFIKGWVLHIEMTRKR